jgi:glycosyltransferase involved in cell wall biosynthesis
VLNNYPGWVAELIREARCGTVVPPDDPAAFAAALCALADDPEKCQQFGANARTLALSRFGREKLAAAFGEFLESVAAH